MTRVLIYYLRSTNSCSAEPTRCSEYHGQHSDDGKDATTQGMVMYVSVWKSKSRKLLRLTHDDQADLIGAQRPHVWRGFLLTNRRDCASLVHCIAWHAGSRLSNTPVSQWKNRRIQAGKIKHDSERGYLERATWLKYISRPQVKTSAVECKRTELRA